MNHIAELERRYQTLYRDFQQGRLDEATFAAEVDALQFQDEWGRYWMMGAQTGSWHYYDGQAWHQADPQDADKLPFMDDRGIYWQRGAKSGDWYYYQPDSQEWVKPSREDGMVPPTPRVGSQRSGQPYYESQLQPADTGPQTPSFGDGDLFQDDEGRYWAIGSKTGQWYFYDHDGWHPAHEFYAKMAPPAPPAPAYSQGTGGYPSSAYSPAPYPPYNPQPAQPPAQPYPPFAYQQSAPPPPAPATPVNDPYAATVIDQKAVPVTPEESKAEPDVSSMPNPPGNRTKSGSWYYFDGKQWMKFSDDEAEDTPPPEFVKETEKAAKPDKSMAKPKEEPVVAELFEDDDEPPPEVVDVEVVTVFEAEPDIIEEEEPIPVARSRRPTTGSSPLPDDEDVTPRRPTRQTKPVQPRREADEEVERPPKRRVGSEPGLPVAPRRREVAHEPTIVIPTDAAASNISPRPASRPVTPVPTPIQQQRAREHTMPMESVKPAAAAPAGPASGAGRLNRSVTQPLPQQESRATASAARARTAPVPVQAPAPTKDETKLVPKVSQPARGATTEKSGYSLGDILRSIPGTVWTFLGGMAALIAFAVLVIAIWIGLQGGSEPEGNLAAVNLPTPTLASAPLNLTPTPGPTPTQAPEALAASEPAELVTFSSETLDLTLEHPEDWQIEEDDSSVILSPSADGLDPENLKDAAFWIARSDQEDVSISDLLAEVLERFPADAETLNQGTISIASRTWTSAQIRFEDEGLGGQGIATLAVTNKDGVGYSLVAVAPAQTWNSIQPTYQEMINSFRFGAESVPVAAASTPAAGEEEDSGTRPDEADEETTGGAGTPAATKTASTPTPTPKVEATPVVHVVQSGDTLLAIANQYRIDVDLLATENGITDPSSLQLGQELVIPFTAEELAAYNARNGGPVPGAGTSAGEAEEEDSPAGDSTAPASGANRETTADTSNSGSAAEEEEAPASAAASIGGRIAYPAFNPSTDSYDLWMVDVATGDQTVIAGDASQPAFNRDGSLLAYRSWDLDDRGIFFRDFVGGRGGKVTGFVEDGLPTWSPDGFSFAFASRREGDRVSRLYRGNQSGEEDFSIGFQGEYPATFPDGRVVAKGCLPSGDCGMFVMGANGGGETKISAETSDTAPAVSPDGSKIAFMSSGRGATNWEIWVMGADGSNAKQLTSNGNNDGLPAWSPDGKSIAYVSDQGGVWAIWVMNADGSNQRKLVNMSGSPDGKVLRDTSNSKGWLEERISWAP